MSEQQETFSGSPPTSSHPAYNMDFIIDFFDSTKNTSQLPASSSFIQLVETAKENKTSNLNLSSSVGEEVTPPPLIVLLMIVMFVVFHSR